MKYIHYTHVRWSYPIHLKQCLWITYWLVGRMLYQWWIGLGLNNYTIIVITCFKAGIHGLHQVIRSLHRSEQSLNVWFRWSAFYRELQFFKIKHFLNIFTFHGRLRSLTSLNVILSLLYNGLVLCILSTCAALLDLWAFTYWTEKIKVNSPKLYLNVLVVTVCPCVWLYRCTTSVYMCREPCCELHYAGKRRCECQHSQVLERGSCYTAVGWLPRESLVMDFTTTFTSTHSHTYT